MTALMLIKTQIDGLIELAGDLTFSTITKKTVLLCDFKNSPQIITLDFSQVQQTDSAGLALVIEWIKLSQTQGRQLKLRHFPQSLQILATLCGFEIQSFLSEAV